MVKFPTKGKSKAGMKIKSVKEFTRTGTKTTVTSNRDKLRTVTFKPKKGKRVKKFFSGKKLIRTTK